MKVLVCDDEEGRAGEVAESIEAAKVPGITIQRLTGDALKDELNALFERVKSRLGEPSTTSGSAKLAFDDADLAIIDNNLAHLHLSGTRLTGESIIGYVRCFSEVPYVVSINKNPDVDFDLRYLVGDYETRADIALNVRHLATAGLWDRAHHERGTFLPWYWPELAKAPERRRKQISFVEKHFEKSVLQSLSFPAAEEQLAYLSLHARAALSPDADLVASDAAATGTPLIDIAFRTVFRDRSRSLPAERDREYLLAAHPDHTSRLGMLARVVAADLDLWFRRDVLGPQDMLVDIPHLLTRMPFLLGENAAELDAWNNAAAATEPPYGLDEALYENHLMTAEFTHPVWTGRPAFWWPQLKGDASLTELFFSSSSGQWADVVFCEDISAFEQRPQDSEFGDGRTEFTAEFEGAWVRRHVAKLPHFGYKPLSRFAV